MRQKRGTTLVELIVSAALLGIFCVAAIALVRPCAQIFLEIQNLARAQMIADTVVEKLRGELLHAQGALRFADVGADGTAVFDRSADRTQGDAVEFLTPSGYFVLLDAGALPPMRLDAPTDGAEQEESPARPAGTLHLRYYRPTADGSSPRGYSYRRGGDYTAYDCTQAYADRFYMGNEVSLHFAVQGMQQTDNADAAPPRVTSLHLTVAIRRAGTVLYTREAILDLVDAPTLRWDAVGTAD